MERGDWRQDVLDELRSLYFDDSKYGKLTQHAHALQCAKQALDANQDSQTVVAALLHDVGWKLARNDDVADDGGFATVSSENSLAAKYGILSFCGSNGADLEQQQAQVLGRRDMIRPTSTITLACSTA
jgi:hypothetical protein